MTHKSAHLFPSFACYCPHDLHGFAAAAWLLVELLLELGHSTLLSKLPNAEFGEEPPTDQFVADSLVSDEDQGFQLFFSAPPWVAVATGSSKNDGKAQSPATGKLLPGADSVRPPMAPNVSNAGDKVASDIPDFNNPGGGGLPPNGEAFAKTELRWQGWLMP